MNPLEAVRAALGDREDVWVVGGTVRDALLKRPLRDIDIAVRSDPEEAARAVARALRGPVFPLSEAFGAWRAIDGGRRFVVDAAPLQGASIEEDLRRRDFSVNAMARALGSQELIDPHGGAADLEAGILRVLGPSAYEDDPLRALRLARLAAELGFGPDPETERLTRAAAPAVATVSAERQFAELRRLVISDGVLPGLELADRLGLVEAVLPELAALHGVEQSHFHHLDVYDHTLEVLRRQIELEGRLEETFGDLAERLDAMLDEPLADELTRREGLRFGALLHDIGKPATRGVLDSGRVTFIGHDRVGAEQVQALARRLRASRRFGTFLAGLTEHHLAVGFLVHERPLGREAIYDYLRRTEPVEVEVTLLSCADRLATRGQNAEAAIEKHLDLARELMADALAWRESGGPEAPLRGDELVAELGLSSGPEIGRLLTRLERAAFTGEATTRDAALELARRLRENGG